MEDAQKHVDHLYQGSHINECVMQSVWLALQDPWKQVNPPILIHCTGQAVEDAQKHVDHLYQGFHINECVMQSVGLALQDR